MTYSEHIYGTGPETRENKSSDAIDGKLIGLAWRIFTDPAAKRSLRYSTPQKAFFAFAWVDAAAEASRHRGALSMLQ